nr:uncharacterized mitochondrial protein AtMg00810-like [Tanacetum cinerariifolium]
MADGSIAISMPFGCILGILGSMTSTTIVAEEVVVSRICMDELHEGAQDTLKLEWNRRGELALSHKECALKWYNIRGDKTCEIRNQEVMNLRVMHSPTFRYLKGTPTLGLYYLKCLGFDLKGYSDLDYAGCYIDRKSTLGAYQILGGKLVCWSAKKQQSVAMSSVKA